MGNYRFDLYSALGVSKNASQPEIKEAYRNLALNFHPDRNNYNGLEKELNDAMCGINEAYSILSNPKKRNEYDILSSGIRFPKPSFYNLVRKANNAAADEETNHPLEAKLEQLLSKGKEIIKSGPTKNVADKVSSALKVSIGFLRAVYQLYQEEKYYKGTRINRRA